MDEPVKENESTENEPSEPESDVSEPETPDAEETVPEISIPKEIVPEKSEAVETKTLGATIISMQSFILTEFGEESYHEWLRALPDESRELLSTHPKLDQWYSLEFGLTEPTRVLCDVFYRGKIQGAWEMGRYSADFGMNTLMKIFLKVTNVSFVVKRAAQIMARYYSPCKAEVIEEGPREAVIRITDFSNMSTYLEHRMAGYMQRAGELTGGRDVNVFIGPSLTKANPYTEFKVQWK
jgi:hypothetical protein